MSGGFEILFEGQTHATSADGGDRGADARGVVTARPWSARGRHLFDRLSALRRGESAAPLQLGRAEARILADVFEAARFEELRTLLARARAAAIDEGR